MKFSSKNIKFKKKDASSIKSYDMGKYVLILGNDATDIFTFYDVEEMHGLNKKDAQAEEVDKTTGNGVYIEGLTNYDPRDKKLTGKSPYKPFVFLNTSHIKKRDIPGKCFSIMHETIHLAMLLNNWDIDNKEEDMTTMAEEEANRIWNKVSNKL
jgi:hypothetical protein